MYSKAVMGVKYLRYLYEAENATGHGIHSPFVYQFVRELLMNGEDDLQTRAIELLRRQCLRNTQLLTLEDLGAGSRIQASKQRTVQQIARAALKPKRFACLFHRIIQRDGHREILELGTSLGITTSYLATAHPAARVTTMEGAPEVAQQARENMERLGLKNVKLQTGNFDDLLPLYLSGIEKLDFAFVDGNHRFEPTLRYFREMLPKIHVNSVLIFDDIHWSREMEEAWTTIKAHPQVTLTIDLFFIGMVFFRKEQLESQHFTIRYV